MLQEEGGTPRWGAPKGLVQRQVSEEILEPLSTITTSG